MIDEPRPRVPHRTTYEATARHEHFIVPLLREAIEERLDRHRPDLPRPNVLDVGCGAQPFRSHLEGLGLAYTALDVQQNAAGTVDVVASIEEPLAADLHGSFGLLLGAEVLEHVADWRAAFASIASALAPGGLAILTCPHVFPLHEAPYDFWRPTPHAFEWAAGSAGLTVVETSGLGTGWDVLGTFAAVSWITPARRTAGSLVTTALLRGLWKALEGGLRRRFIQRIARLEGHVPLSTVAVLRRP